MRLVFLGTGDIGLPSLEALLASRDHEVVAAVTQPDKPVGRKMVLTAPQVKVRAQAAGIPVLQPQRIRNAVQELTVLQADAFIVVVSEETGNVSLARGGRMNSILQPRLLAEELKALFGRTEGAARLRPFAREVGRAVRSVPRTTLGTLRTVIRKS